MMKNSKYSIKTILLFSLLFIIAASTDLAAQYKGLPVKKEKLVSVLRSRQLQTREVVAVIKSNGVEFQMTPLIEAELNGAGARPEVIAAARDNYRAPAVVATPVRNGGTIGRKTPTKFSGDPLSKEAIIVLLENGVPDTQVRKNVGARGVSFNATAADKNQIKKAGGTVALVNLIAASYVPDEGTQPVTNNRTTAKTTAEKYDEFVDKASAQIEAKDFNGAIRSLQEAVKLDPTAARGYQVLGFMHLYGQKNFAEAEKNMQQAIDLGGSAVFRVYHDHGALMTDVCEGSIFIAKDSVRFESDNNVHTFQASDEEIKEAKMAGKFLAAFNARQGAFKIILKKGDNKNFNFAPATNDGAESKMLVRLIGKKK